MRTSLPLWSAHALLESPEIVGEIHRAYVEAGAELLTANTFRTQRRTLQHAGLGGRARELTRLAVDLAHAAAAEADRGASALVLGSAPPLEDCYRPDLVPDPETLDREHREHVENLARAGVDAVLVETMNSAREAAAAGRAAHAAALPWLVSFVCGSGPELLSGEALSEALDAVLDLGPLAVGVNCMPPSGVARCLEALQATELPTLVYANLGEPEEESGFQRSDDCSPEEFAAQAASWAAAGASIVGGCCGTGPEHIRAVARLLSPLPR